MGYVSIKEADCDRNQRRYRIERKKQIRSDKPVPTADEDRKRFEEVVHRLGDETAL